MCSYMSGRTKYPSPLLQRRRKNVRGLSLIHLIPSPLQLKAEENKYAAFFLANKTKTLFQLLRFSPWPNYDRTGNDLIVRALIKHNTCKHAKGKHAITQNYRGDAPLSQSAPAAAKLAITGASTQDKISSLQPRQ